MYINIHTHIYIHIFSRQGFSALEYFVELIMQTRFNFMKFKKENPRKGKL